MNDPSMLVRVMRMLTIAILLNVGTTTLTAGVSSADGTAPTVDSTATCRPPPPVLAPKPCGAYVTVTVQRDCPPDCDTADCPPECLEAACNVAGACDCPPLCPQDPAEALNACPPDCCCDEAPTIEVGIFAESNGVEGFQAQPVCEGGTSPDPETGVCADGSRPRAPDQMLLRANTTFNPLCGTGMPCT